MVRGYWGGDVQASTYLSAGVLNHSTRPISGFWPVIIAPLVAGVYYLALKTAFAQSIVSVLGHTATTDIDLSDVLAPQWGSHWVYRGASELISAGFGTFVAAGLALGHERLAAIVGSCMISFQALVRTGVLVFAWKYVGINDATAPEPWYQYAIDALMIFAAPAVGAYVSEAAADMHRDVPIGFGGINRLHFLWLWLPAFFYAIGLITPMARIYIVAQDQSVIAIFLVALVNLLPVAAVAVPGFYGLTLLAGHHGHTMHPAGRNMVGALVLVFGFVVGIGVQSVWYWVVQNIFDAIFG